MQFYTNYDSRVVIYEHTMVTILDTGVAVAAAAASYKSEIISPVLSLHLLFCRNENRGRESVRRKKGGFCQVWPDAGFKK